MNSFSRDNLLYLNRIEKRMLRSGVPSARSEAENLVRHFGRTSRVDFFTGEKTLSSRAKRSIQSALKKRLSGRPLSHVLKEAHFCGHRFFVNRHVLTPRPETELLVEEVIKLMSFPQFFSGNPGVSGSPIKAFGDDRNFKILDIGTGCGAIAVSLTIARPDCRMTALELSPKALGIARKNIGAHGLGEKIRLVRSDLFGFWAGREKEAWDLLVSNPPYIPDRELSALPVEVRAEPRVALDGGPRGLAVIDKILEQAPLFLRKGGWLVMEIGKGQAKPLAEKLATDRRYRGVRFVKDFLGIERILVVQKRRGGPVCPPVID